MEYTVYALIDPDTGIPHYVGATADLEQRVRIHRSSIANATNPSLRDWLAGLREHGKRPAVQVLETCDERSSNQREREWIQHFLDEGYPLLNRLYNPRYQRPMHLGSKVGVSTSLEPETIRRLRQIAARQGTTVGAWIRDLVERELQNDPPIE